MNLHWLMNNYLDENVLFKHIWWKVKSMQWKFINSWSVYQTKKESHQWFQANKTTEPEYDVKSSDDDDRPIPPPKDVGRQVSEPNELSSRINLWVRMPGIYGIPFDKNRLIYNLLEKPIHIDATDRSCPEIMVEIEKRGWMHFYKGPKGKGTLPSLENCILIGIIPRATLSGLGVLKWISQLKRSSTGTTMLLLIITKSQVLCLIFWTRTELQWNLK